MMQPAMPIMAAPMQPVVVATYPFPVNAAPGMWKVDLCGWVNMCAGGGTENCLMSSFCGFIRIGQIMGRMGFTNYVIWMVAYLIAEFMYSYGNRYMSATDERTWCTDPAYSAWRDVNNSYCLGMYIAWAVQFCGWVLLVLIGMTVRQKVVQRYQIQEAGMVSCLIACFCVPCNLCQMGAQVDLSEIGNLQACNCDFRPPVHLVANPTYPQQV